MLRIHQTLEPSAISMDEFKLKDDSQRFLYLKLSFNWLIKTQEIQANSQSSMTIELKEDTESWMR